jgi:signal transduction histidine kinase
VTAVTSRAVREIALVSLPLVMVAAMRPFGLAFPARFYLPFHTLLEVAVTSAALATFAVQWFAAGAGAFRENRARFIGPAFLGVALLEAAHLLTFPGMPGILGPSSTERGIYYWLASRIWTIGALVAAARLGRDSRTPLLGRRRIAVASVLVVAALVAIDLALPAKRAMFFLEGRGLTPLKLAMESVVGLAAIAGAVLHGTAARRTGDRVSAQLAQALVLAALGEICFMLYTHAYDPFNMLGHAYVLASTWFVLEALFVAAILRPYRELDALRAHVEDELVVTIRQLRETTEQREDILRAVSHDVRNPLQVVLLQTERILRVAKEEAARGPAANILTAGRRIERMLRDLTDSARVEAGALQLSLEPVELHGFVAELLALTAGVLDGSRVVNDVPAGTPPVAADRDRLERIMVNLVGNALKYTRSGVRIGAAREGDAVKITVSDEGPGIEPQDLPRVFERYYRGQRHEGEGLGLGLYIVRKLVEAHGGRIWADSRTGEGTTFSFTLPLADR